MKTKQPMLIIVAGAACAIVAVLMVQRALLKARPVPVAEPGVPLLVAMREISYGEPIVLQGTGDKANVMFVPDYPVRLKPEGAITEPEKITTRQMRAKVAFVKHEPVLEPEIVPDSQFVPPDMMQERVSVDADDVKSGRVVAGHKVDVFKIVGNTPVDFMRSVAVYATEMPDASARKGQSAYASLLIKKEDRVTFLKAKYAGQFLLVPAADPEAEGPVLVDTTGSEEAQKADVRAQLDAARELTKKGQYEDALAALEAAQGKYPDLKDLNDEMGGEIAQCRRQLADKLYQDARKAVDQNADFTTALRLVDRIEREFAEVDDVVKKAQALAQDAQKARSAQLAQARYEALLTDLPAAIDQGNLPRAEQLVGDLEQFKATGFAPQGGLVKPEAALADYSKKLADAQGRYDVDKKVLESFLKQQDYEQARAKLDQMHQRFPSHPELGELAKQVPPATPAGQ